MRDALARVDRDIVYALCQYGYGEVWKWGAEAGGHLWRSSGDLLDQWANLESVGFRQAGRERWTRPGEWNDTDMLVVGTLGWGPNLRPTRLTPNEQMLHHRSVGCCRPRRCSSVPTCRSSISSRSRCSPIHEVIDVDQDPLGRAAGRIWADARREIWARPLADGTMAVGLFNRGLAASITVTLVGPTSACAGRSRCATCGNARISAASQDSMTATVPRHGVVFVKIGKPR